MPTLISGSTGVNKITDGTIVDADVTDVAASKLTGTIADARFPSTLPAASAANLTAIPAANITGTLPAIDGSNLTGIGGLYASIAIICDQKAYNANGGTFTNGAWRPRDLNTEISDVSGIVSIASNQFTLQAGTYTIEWSAPSFRVEANSSRLYNITDTSVEQYSSSQYNYDQVAGRAEGADIITITGAKVFEIQHRCATSFSTNGLGNAADVDSGAVSIYTIVKILKHA